MKLPDNKSKNYSRKLSSTDLLSIAWDRVMPFNNQMVFEGTGVLDPDRWAAAVEKASAANPGSRLILKGHPLARRWVDSGVTPRVRVVDGSSWTGYSNKGAPFLLEQLPPVQGPTCEVVLVQGNPLRVIFRSNHGVMDARGTLLWAEDIFRALRGEAVLGSTSTLNDEECCKNLIGTKPKIKIKKVSSRNITPGVAMQGDSGGVVWLRKTIQGRYRNLQSQIIYLAAQEAWKGSAGNVVMCVSVDLRRHMPPETIITGFLSGSIYLEVKPGDTPEKITGMLKGKLNAKREISYSRMNRLLFLMPPKLINYLMHRIGSRMHRSGRYVASGMVVNLGLVPLEKYTGGGFHPVSFIGIPTYIDIIPFFIAVMGSGKNIDVMITMNTGLASNGRIEAIMDSITSQLVSE